MGIFLYFGQLFHEKPKIQRKNLKKLSIFFKVTIHFLPTNPQPNIINTSFCAVVGSLLTKLNHYYNDSTVLICFLDAAPLKHFLHMTTLFSKMVSVLPA